MFVDAKVLLRSGNSGVSQADLLNLNLSEKNSLDISLNLSRENIVSLNRVDNNLIAELTNGETLRIKDFFEENLDGKKNRLLLSENNSIEFVDLSPFEAVSTINPTLASAPVSAVTQTAAAPGLIFASASAIASGGVSLAPLAGIAGGLGAGAAGIASFSGGEGGNNDSSLVEAFSTPENLALAGNGSSLTGEGVPGATITVRSAAGEQIGTATVDPSGQFVVELSQIVPAGASVLVGQTLSLIHI